MEALRTRPAPFWGLKAVLVRFVGTSLLVALPLALLERTPFQPSYLVFIKEENYYRMLVFLFPVFGVFTWLLMSSCAHVGLHVYRCSLFAAGEWVTPKTPATANPPYSCRVPAPQDWSSVQGEDWSTVQSQDCPADQCAGESFVLQWSYH
jgi:hypothetical protein